MSDADTKDNKKDDNKLTETPPITRQHELQLESKTLRYTSTTGLMPLKDAEKDEIEAQMFYTAYTLDGVPDVSERPLFFVFNGGPGSSSIWLHMGAIGPYRVKMQDEGWMPQPPYRLEPNEHTWLDFADLVFIDPVGTGYSRAAKSEDNQKYWSVDGDLSSVGQFIRLYLTRNKRWTSPLYLSGESYGTTRASGLSGYLLEGGSGIALNGLVLISTVMNFQTLLFAKGNDLPFNLYIPTYAATAWYHGKLADELQQMALRDLLDQVEAWTETDYTLALMKGDKLDADTKQSVAAQLARYTGLDVDYIIESDLRIHIWRFCKALLRDENRTVGRLDSRFKGISGQSIAEFPEFDPSMTAITPPYTAMFYDYVRDQLGYESDLNYEVLNYKVNQGWEWDRGSFADTSERLRNAFNRNPFMKVLVAQGYYDLATPHFAAEYTVNHSGIDPELHENVSYAYYEAGHMFYLHVKELEKLKADVVKFME
jgi:carboxypeptidase C (cathepsin A)